MSGNSSMNIIHANADAMPLDVPDVAAQWMAHILIVRNHFLERDRKWLEAALCQRNGLNHLTKKDLLLLWAHMKYFKSILRLRYSPNFTAPKQGDKKSDLVKHLVQVLYRQDDNNNNNTCTVDDELLAEMQAFIMNTTKSTTPTEPNDNRQTAAITAAAAAAPVSLTANAAWLTAAESALLNAAWMDSKMPLAMQAVNNATNSVATTTAAASIVNGKLPAVGGAVGKASMATVASQSMVNATPSLAASAVWSVVNATLPAAGRPVGNASIDSKVTVAMQSMANATTSLAATAASMPSLAAVSSPVQGNKPTAKSADNDDRSNGSTVYYSPIGLAAVELRGSCVAPIEVDLADTSPDEEEDPPLSSLLSPQRKKARLHHYHHPLNPYQPQRVGSPPGSMKRKRAELKAFMAARQKIHHQRPVTETTTATAQHTLTYVKQETDDANDESCTPKDEIEKSLLAKLQQMGFTDNREILHSIRKLRNNNSQQQQQQQHQQQPTCDDIMIHLITQREEAEEARKMDEARLLSEQARKEEASRRRKEQEEETAARLESASLHEWSTNPSMFAESWLLAASKKHEKDSNNKNRLAAMVLSNEKVKFKLLALLQLEKKSLKWYGKALPKCYFENTVRLRLLTEMANADTLARQLQLEADMLSESMYQLSAQSGGVPRIFLTAMDEKGQHHDKKNNNNNDNDDDDVEVVFVGTSTRDSPGRRTKPRLGMPKVDPTEVIEIL